MVDRKMFFLTAICLLFSPSAYGQSLDCGSSGESFTDKQGVTLAYKTAGYSCLKRSATVISKNNIEAGFLSRPGFIPQDAQAQKIHKVDQVKLKMDVDGRDIPVGIWDEGVALIDHVELEGRLALGDLEPGTTKKTISMHATHVTGTILSSGINSAAEGIASRAVGYSNDWDNDFEELTNNRQISVSNHSYGPIGGWSNEKNPRSGRCNHNWHWWGDASEKEDWKFGAYSYAAHEVDKLIFNERNDLSVIVAAGNEAAEDSDPYSQVGFRGAHCIMTQINNKITGEKFTTWKASGDKREKDTFKDRYDTIAGMALAKNVITVGALIDLPTNFQASDISVTNFSSIGGADDGRIKPDVVANGALLTSTYPPNKCEKISCLTGTLTKKERELYHVESGTSMASPVVAGIAVLLNEISRDKSPRKRFLFADEMKAILIHTARSPFENRAPSYDLGWGIVDAWDAAQVTAGNTGVLRRILLSNYNDEFEISVDWTDASKNMRITTSWLDPELPEDLLTKNLNDRTKDLVANIDTRLISPSGKTFYPWRLDPVHPSAKAVNSCINGRACANEVDNSEVIDVEKFEWESGEWKLKVNKNNLPAAFNHLKLVVVND